MQLEVPVDEIAALARRARGRGARVILNAAPAATLGATLLDDVDVLVVNEFEAKLLAGSADLDMQAACRLLASPSRSVVATLGSAGALRSSRCDPHSILHRSSTSSTPSARATRSPPHSRSRSIGVTPSKARFPRRSPPEVSRAASPVRRIRCRRGKRSTDWRQRSTVDRGPGVHVQRARADPAWARR